MSEMICWVVMEEGGIEPVTGVVFMIEDMARVSLADGRSRTTRRSNLRDPDYPDQQWNYGKWLLEMP